MLSETNQTEKDEYFTLLFICWNFYKLNSEQESELPMITTQGLGQSLSPPIRALKTPLGSRKHRPSTPTLLFQVHIHVYTHTHTPPSGTWP